MKIDTCKTFPLKYSSSMVSSITTTFPSQGAITKLSSMVYFLLGILKKDMINNQRKREMPAKIQHSVQQEVQRNLKTIIFNNANINAVMAIVLYPSL
jgi:hypothetical protein